MAENPSNNSDVTTIPSSSIPRRLLSLVTKIDVCFTRQLDTKRGQGSGFGVLLDSTVYPQFDVLINKCLDFNANGNPPTVPKHPIWVTCRHLVDRIFQSQEYGWSLSTLGIELFGEQGTRLDQVNFSHGEFCVLVPKNEKLDLALLSFDLSDESLRHTLSILESNNDKLPVMSVQNLMEDIGMCNTMPWGAEVGFTSIQPWTNGYPIIRSGRVSSDPKVSFQSPDIEMEDIYLLEAQSFAGSSGTPVVSYPTGNPVLDHVSIVESSGKKSEPEKYRRPHLVGVMSGHIRNNIGESGELYRMHVGLSYCHKLEVLYRVLFEEPLERLWPR